MTRWERIEAIVLAALMLAAAISMVRGLLA